MDIRTIEDAKFFQIEDTCSGKNHDKSSCITPCDVCGYSPHIRVEDTSFYDLKCLFCGKPESEYNNIK